MKIKFSKLDERAIIPSYAKDDDACLDLTAIEYTYNCDTDTHDYDFGLAVEIPSGHVGLIFSRSSVAKKDLMLANGTGVIDAGYRGPLSAKFKETLSPGFDSKTYEKGDRVAQLMVIPIPHLEPVEVAYEELSKTERGIGGWGSSGN